MLNVDSIQTVNQHPRNFSGVKSPVVFTDNLFS